MGIALKRERVRLMDWDRWFEGDLETLFIGLPNSLVAGTSILSVPEIAKNFNYFGASSRFLADAVMSGAPSELETLIDSIVEPLAMDWSITSEFCLILENGLLRPIKAKYVHPIRLPRKPEIIIGYYFVFPKSPPDGRAFVIHFDELTGRSLEGERDYTANEIGNDWRSVQEGGVSAVFYANTNDAYYGDISGIVRELQVRFSMLQLALNSTSIPLLQIGIEGVKGTSVSGEITPATVSQLGKSGLGFVIPPPFIGEEGARYVERQGTGLQENMDYIRLLLGALSATSGVPDYVYGVTLNQSRAEVERAMFAGLARIARGRRRLERLFARLGLPVVFDTSAVTSMMGDA